MFLNCPWQCVVGSFVVCLSTGLFVGGDVCLGLVVF